MDMLNPFPSLLDFAILAPLILRLALGVVVGSQGYKLLAGKKLPALTLLVLSALVIIGLGTQIAALLILIGYVITSLQQKTDKYLLIMASAASLLFLGAGPFSLDLPL